MALVTTIDPNDIAVAVGQDAPEPASVKAQQWQMWINDALMLIQARVDELQVDESAVVAAKLDYVVREAVVTHVRNPDNATQVTVAIDDGSSSRLYKSSSGRVQIADEWWTLLGLTPSAGQAFQIDTVSCGTIHQPWCSITWGASCSCGANLTGAAGYPLWEY